MASGGLKLLSLLYAHPGTSCDTRPLPNASYPQTAPMSPRRDCFEMRN